MTIQYQNQNLTVFESALYRTTTTVLDLESAWLLVDPNWLPQEIKAIKDFIQENDALRHIYILFTHSDFDHILGYGAFPNARVIAHKDFVEHPFREKMIQQIHDFDDSFYIIRPYRIQYPHVDVVIDKEGQTLQIGNQDVVLYSAKGHVRDGLMAFLPKDGICIAGDYLSNIEIPWVEYSFKEYQQTLRRFDEKVGQYDIQTLIPGHGDVAVSLHEITERIRLDTQYIDGFLKAFKSDSQFFESFLSSRGFALQNRNIHGMNTAFYQSGDVFL